MGYLISRKSPLQILIGSKKQGLKERYLGAEYASSIDCAFILLGALMRTESPAVIECFFNAISCDNIGILLYQVDIDVSVITNDSIKRRYKYIVIFMIYKNHGRNFRLALVSAMREVFRSMNNAE